MSYNLSKLVLLLILAAYCLGTDQSLPLPSIKPCFYVQKDNSSVDVHVHCNNTNLAKLSLTLASLKSVPIQKLTVQSSKIARLFGSIFHNVAIRELEITDTKVEKIEENVFRGNVASISTLILTNSSLPKIPSAALKGTSLRDLTIQGHLITALQKTDLYGWSSSLQQMSLTFGLLKEIDANAFMETKQIKRLDLQNNQIDALQTSQFQGMRELEFLDLSHNEINKLETKHIGNLGKLTVFNISNNKIPEISRSLFAKNAVLKVLDLSHNNLKRLDSHHFRGLRFLRRIYLKSNNIMDINRGTFSSIKRIGTIDLAENLITEIAFEMFVDLQYIEVIDVAKNKVQKVSKGSFKDLYLTQVNLSQNHIDQIEPGAFENCINMTYLDLSFNGISLLKQGVFDALSYPSNFDFSNNNISTFSWVSVENMIGLRTLNLTFNQITSLIKTSKPLSLHELSTIDVSHNNLEHIPDGTFGGLSSLRSLNISHNLIKAIKFGTIGSITTLTHLDLSNNHIDHVHKEAFVKLDSLRVITLNNNFISAFMNFPLSLNELHLQNNQINSLNNHEWPLMNSLLLLDLTGNQVRNKIGEASFINLNTVQKLYLANNSLSEIPRGAFSGLKTVQYLGLNDNKIQTVEKDAFGYIPILEINLSGNNISSMSDQSFKSLTTLGKLDLSNNKIKQVSGYTFFGLSSLRVLDLSRNLIPKLNNGTYSILEPLLSLEEVYLQQNNLSFLTKQDIPASDYYPYKFTTLDLSNNYIPFLSKEVCARFPKLVSLNISFNILEDIRNGSFTKMESLKYLDASGNKLEEIDLQKLPISLISLNVSGNHVNRLILKKPIGHSNISFLNLNDNELQMLNSSFLPPLAKGLKLRVNGNRFYCDCWIIDFRNQKQASGQLQDNDDLFDQRCMGPENLQGKIISEIRNTILCNSSKETDDLVQQIDIKFNSVMLKNQQLFVSWKLLSSDDVGGFYVGSKDSEKNTLVGENHLSYDVRSVVLPVQGLLEYRHVEICVLTKTSTGFIKKFYPKQCFNFGTAWKNINERCTHHSKQICNLYNANTDTFVSNNASTYRKVINKFLFQILIYFLVCCY